MQPVSRVPLRTHPARWPHCRISTLFANVYVCICLSQLCLSHASGSLVLRHLHPGDWLGKPDSLTMRVNAGGLGTYYNPLVDKREHLVEPWSGLVECHSERGDATTQLRVEVQSRL